jgi:hypothetical protein
VNTCPASDSATTKNARPWLLGAGVCKGRICAQAAAPISFFVDVPVDPSGFVSPAMVGVRENAREVTAALLKRRGKAERLVQAINKDVADVVVTIIGREMISDRRVVHVRVAVQGKTFEIEGASEDDWDGAASEAGARTADWITENRERIAQGRRER